MISDLFKTEYDEPRSPEELPLEIDADTEQNEKPNGEGDGMIKKRKTRKARLGVGGFFAKPKGGRALFKRGTLIQKLPQELLSPTEDRYGDGDEPKKKKQKQKWKKRLPMLEDSYPSYLQEAFFGKTVLEAGIYYYDNSSQVTQYPVFELNIIL